ncbi:MAG: MGMT family protein [Chitinispirillaceae bacterium]|nr:MGMT family protein [Chitinispirillaceae bacterium]
METNRLINPSGLLRFPIRHPVTDVTLFGRRKKGRITLVAVRFGTRTSHDGRKSTVSPHPDLIRYGRMIKGFLDGKVKDLSRVPLDLSGWPAFSRKVLLAARRIPYGKAVSYARLAAMAGNPGAVRAAASVMRSNLFPLVVPCHRVIRSDGSTGGFMGKTRGREVRLKCRLLKRESAAS